MPPTATQREHASKGQAAYRAGDYQTAASHFEQLLRSDRNNPDAMHMLATALTHLGRYADAQRHLKKALAARPKEAKYLSQLGVVHKQSGELDESRARIEEALRLAPDLPQALRVKAELLRLVGEHEQAAETLRPAVESGDASAAIRTLFGRLIAKTESIDEGVAILRSVMADDSSTPGQRAHAAFELGRLFDQAQRYDEAFQAFKQGNELRKPTFDPQSHRAAIDHAIEWWTRERIASLPASTVTDDRLIFIVGMPRSGTSLIEQILASHPDCYGAGERPDVIRAARPIEQKITSGEEIRKPDIDKPARTYARDLRKLSNNARRVTDKMPQNFLQLGLIRLMFPNARVIHTQRNPLDTCLSCYFQEFSAAHAYSYDLAWLADYHNQYQRLMDHWRRIVDLPMLDVVYENLVENQEPVTRDILDFAGLDWHDACLRFHETDRVTATQSNEQVTEKMYTRAVGRHTHYEPHIAPLREGLEPS